VDRRNLSRSERIMFVVQASVIGCRDDASDAKSAG